MTIRRDTGRATLPALPTFVPTDPKAMASWAQKVAERLEVREGARGNPYERSVTLRELQDATKDFTRVIEEGKREPGPGEFAFDIGGGLSAVVAIEKFTAALRETRLYKDLLTRLDDPDRFNAFASEIRNSLLKSIADEAAARGADVRRTETLIQDTNRSLALAVEEITASLSNNSAGIRELQATYVNQQSATATKVTQLEVSLGNYYQDGLPGRVQLEQELTTQASFTNGLRGQYTLKIQAGGALAGFGLAAEEVDGVPSSAFIISADKFAIVSPSYSGGLTTSPDVNKIPFGVDADGIYLNNSVYIKGNLRVDTGGKTLIDGLRGSLAMAATGSIWSDITARQAIWAGMLKEGSAPNNNHLVIGDKVTISGTNYTETRQWNGTAWVNPGAVFSGSVLVDGTVSATKINTQGLTIRDANGNAVFTSGVSSGINGAYVTGLGTMAYRNDARIGDTVKFADGSTMNTSDFVNRLSKIDVNTISTFMANAAIGTAYIGNAAVSTLKIAGEAVVVSRFGQSSAVRTITGSAQSVASLSIPISGLGPGETAPLVVIGLANYSPFDSTGASIVTYIEVNGVAASATYGVTVGGGAAFGSNQAYSLLGNGNSTVRLMCRTSSPGATSKQLSVDASIVVISGKR
jgi:hypothetical protein